jgi:ferredoxin
MLDFADGADPASRLACQVRVARGCDGMVVHVPAEQRTLGL